LPVVDKEVTAAVLFSSPSSSVPLVISNTSTHLHFDDCFFPISPSPLDDADDAEDDVGD
jgi:hypothetical protein